MDFIRFLSRYESQIYAILRIVTGFLFLWHGSQKLFNIPPSPVPPGGALPPQMIIAGIIEFVGGILILTGLWTRWAALLSLIVMAVAYLTIHAPKDALPLANHGESALVYFFLFLYFFIRGSGIWSIDQLIHRKIPLQRNNLAREIPVK